MPKIQIDVPKDAYEKLKIQAKDDDRSLTKYITRGVVYLSDIPNGYHKQQQNSPQVLDLSTLPEGTTIKTTTPRQLTPEEEEQQRYKNFQKLAKQILGHELENVSDYRIYSYDNNTYYDEQYAKPIQEGSAIKSMYIYNLPIAKQTEYLEEFKHYEK